MTDIKITLSQDKTIYAGDIDLEDNWLREKELLWYPLCKGKPRKVNTNDWVYFILKGQIVGRARVVKLEKPEVDLKSYQDKIIKTDRWGIWIKGRIEKPKKIILHPGFQGFRYLKQNEKKRYERAFMPA